MVPPRNSLHHQAQAVVRIPGSSITKPELFPILRSVIDRYRRPGRFLLLGSASQTLVNQSAESLAGRVSFWELTPFLPHECAPDTATLFQYLVRGGFPESFLAADDQVSLRWRQAFLRSTIERDLPLLGLKTPVPLLSVTVNSTHLPA